MKQKSSTGFTIVELLIVIVVIAILAAISIVAYNGIQDRSRVSTASADISNSSKKASLSLADNGSIVNTPDFVAGATSALNVTGGIYKVFTLCASTTTNEFAVAAELNSGDVYYSKNGSAPVKTTSVTSTNPCPSLSIASPVNVFANMPTSTCAIQGGSCTFTGTKSIAYGSPTKGKFYAKTQQASPVACDNTNFGDPAVGDQKWCYILQY